MFEKLKEQKKMGCRGRKSCRTRPSIKVWKKTKYRRKKTQKWRARSAEEEGGL